MQQVIYANRRPRHFAVQSDVAFVGPRMRRGISALAMIVIASSAPNAVAGHLGPTPYLQASDSPFAAIAFDYFYLENFEDNLFNVPGATKTVSSIIGHGLAVDSVDADDGVIDGSGNDGRSLRTVGFTPASVTFTFDAVVLGTLPTHAGIVWTDGGTATRFEAFGPGMVSLGTIGPFNFSDGNSNGGTAEDRFFGWSDLNGILAIKISPSGASMEVDHLQYGFAIIAPEPGIIMLVGMGVVAIAMFNRRRAGVAWYALVPWLAVSCGPALAVDVDWVTVGNPGNAPDEFNVTYGRAWGSVNHVYQIGKYEVTNAQYAEFLNAKATVGDTLALYDTQMSNSALGGINRSGGGTAVDPFVYTVKNGRGINPVVFVNWYDALRFANWLNNGQGISDTESGSYTLLGGTPIPSNAFPSAPPIARNPGARVVLPSEDEWYKAAYHKNDGVTGNYWDYPTATDDVPFSDQPPGADAPQPFNAANQAYSDGIANGYDDGYAVTGSSSFSETQNYLADVGAYAQSIGPYGTFDQAGNVSEWTESLFGEVGYFRALRGGDWGCCFGSPGGAAAAFAASGDGPELNYFRYGFRVAMVPEPAALVLIAMGVGLLTLRRRRVAMATVGRAVTRRRRRHFGPSAACGLIVASWVSFASASWASAAMFNASNVAELISAINVANQNVDPDSISLAPGVTFTLTIAENETNGPTGLPTIAAGQELSIFGNGAVIERSAATETPTFRLFDVAAGAALRLENLTLQGGHLYGSPVLTSEASAKGGAIFNQGDLALHNVTLQDNMAVGLIGYYARGYSAAGGGVYSSGRLTMQGGAIQNNLAQGGLGGHALIGRDGASPGGPGGHGWGGGLYIADGTATLSSVIISANTVQGGAGGRGATTTNHGTRIATRGGRGGDGSGGGLFVADGAVAMYDGAVTNNIAAAGAGGAGGNGPPPGAHGANGLVKGGGLFIETETVMRLDELTFTRVTSNTPSNFYGSFEVLPNQLPGDYNSDDVVDAADYTVWRNSVGGTMLANRGPGITGPIGDADYEVWKMHYGEELPALGAGSLAAMHLVPGESPRAMYSVPEPASIVTFVGTLLVCRRIWRSRNFP